MRTLRSQAHWTLALIGGFCLVAAAVTVAQRPTLSPPVTARDAHELSAVFRNVASTTVKSVVTIETRVKAQRAEVQREGARDPLEEFFKSDPRFRDFFRRMPRGQMPDQQGMGSGFIVEESGLIVTNNHVVADADEIIVRLHDGREFKGTDVRSDPRTDLAVFTINTGEKLPALKFGDSDSSQVGDWVIAVGNPFGHELTVTSGIISAKGRGPGIAEREDFLQTDAAINPGNSGGPLLNLNGDVIGVNTAISSRSGGFDGIGFAVPSRMAWWVVKQLIDEGRVKRAYIGISIQPVVNGLAEELNLKVGEGAIVTQILPDSPGADAGLEVGDVVLSLDGKAVTSPRNLQGIVERLEIDTKYMLEIQRDEKRSKLPIVLKEMPQDYTLANVLRRGPQGRQETDESVTVEEFGFKVQDITSEIAEQLGIDAEEGVVVSSVDSDGPASRSLNVGDVIEKVGRIPVRNVEEFNKAIKQTTGRKGLLLLVRSGNATRFVAIQKDD